MTWVVKRSRVVLLFLCLYIVLIDKEGREGRGGDFKEGDSKEMLLFP